MNISLTDRQTSAEKYESGISRSRNRIFWFWNILLLVLFSFTLILTGCRDEPASPNIVLITADDLGLQLSCYGDSTVLTQNIDALARDGIRFNNAYVTQASCSPSRSSIFTGLYPHENGQIGLSHRGEFEMVPGLMTLPKMFRELGYPAGVIGKVHVRPKSDFPFDYNTNDGFPANETKDVVRVRDSVRSFLDQYGNRPFFLMVNYFDPHRNYRQQQFRGLPEKLLGPEDVDPFPFIGLSSGKIMEDIAGYYNCVKRLDEGIGMLIAELEKRDLLDNTLILFLGDHGPPFPRAKVSCYEAGLKIPMILVWPGRVPPGSIRDDLVSTIDIFPTFAAATGWTGEVPGEGKSLLPDTGTQNKRQYLFAEYNAHQSSSFHPQRSICDGRYKLILTLIENRTFVGDNQPPARLADYLELARGDTAMKRVFGNYILPPKIQLYDLSSDPYEMKDLGGDPACDSIVVRLLTQLELWRERTHDPFLDATVLKSMAREQDSLKRIGKLRVHRAAFPYMNNAMKTVGN